MQKEAVSTTKKKSDRLSPNARRKQLIEATLVCLMRDGAEGLSSRKICIEAGVSTGLLNHHFSGQIDLLAAAYETISLRYHKALQLRIEANQTPVSLPIVTLVECAFEPDIMCPDQLRAWVVFWSKTIDSPVMRSVHDTINERLNNYLVSVLGRSLPNLGADQLHVLAVEYSALSDGLWLDWSLNGKNKEAHLWQAILDQWLQRTLALA